MLPVSQSQLALPYTHERNKEVINEKKVIKKQKDPRITQKRCQKVDER